METKTFELVTANNKVFRINTSTGEVWHLNTFNNQWVKVQETGHGIPREVEG